jgi:hypothetical protein
MMEQTAVQQDTAVPGIPEGDAVPNFEIQVRPIEMIGKFLTIRSAEEVYGFLETSDICS